MRSRYKKIVDSRHFKPIYLVDGYNFVFRLGLKKKLTLQTRREEFIKTLNECVEKLNLHVTIVFDGKDMPEGSYTRGNWKDIDLVYTHHGLSADEYILRYVADNVKNEKCIVVTSDRELGSKVRAFGMSVLTVEEFMQFLLNKTLPSKNKRKEKPLFKEAGFHFDRLLKIFEEKLKEHDEK